MAKKQEIKNYQIIVRDGRFIFQTTKKSSDGKYHSLSLPYPFTQVSYNAETAQTEITKLTRKQTENYCLKHAQAKGWFN